MVPYGHILTNKSPPAAADGHTQRLRASKQRNGRAATMPLQCRPGRRMTDCSDSGRRSSQHAVKVKQTSRPRRRIIACTYAAPQFSVLASKITAKRPTLQTTNAVNPTPKYAPVGRRLPHNDGKSPAEYPYLEHDATGVRVSNLDLEVNLRIRRAVCLLRRHFRRLLHQFVAGRHFRWLSIRREQRPLLRRRLDVH